MPNIIAIPAELDSKDRFAIVVARWNETITRKLLDGAVAKLRDAGVPDDAIHVAWVPGAMEIPLVAKRLGPPTATWPSFVSARSFAAKPRTTSTSTALSAPQSPGSVSTRTFRCCSAY